MDIAKNGPRDGQAVQLRSPDSLVPEDHPLRAIRALNGALERLSPTFAVLYAEEGRPSIAPERLRRALLLQALFTIRSESWPRSWSTRE
jgi:transposase